MGNKKTCILFIFIFTVFLGITGTFLFPVFADEYNIENKNYSLEVNEEGDVVFIQKLSWEPVEYVLYYEVILERESNGNFVEIDLIKTETNSVNISLGAGSYRYKILIYNLLGRLEIETDYFGFAIIKAIQPEVKKLSPEVIYLEEKNDGIYLVEGKNLFEDSSYIFYDANSKKTIEGSIIDYKTDVLKLSFDIKLLDKGNYDLIVTNPGGLSDQSQQSVVKFKKLMDFDVSAGYVFPIIIRDETIGKYFGSIVFPLSGSAKLTFIPVKRNFGYFGFSVSANYSRLVSRFSNYEIGGNLLTGYLNFVYQFPIIKQRIVLDVHGGAGIVAFNNIQFKFQNNIKSEVFNSLSVAADAGFSFQFYILKRLYVEIGCDYSATFMKDMAFDLISPVALIGWQF